MNDRLTGDDQELWKRLRQGDSDALSGLFRRYYPLLYDYGVKLSQHEDLTRDAIQDVFAYVWEKHASLSRVRSVRAYLLVSLRRWLLNAMAKHRDHKRKAREFSQQQPETVFSFEDLVVLEEKSREDRQALLMALDQIPTRLREALYLKMYDSLSYREIAQIMSISPQVARNYVCEAFQRIRETFNKLVKD